MDCRGSPIIGGLLLQSKHRLNARNRQLAPTLQFAPPAMRHPFRRIRAAILCSTLTLLVSALLAARGLTWANEPNAALVGVAYEKNIHPLLERYCHDCHGGGDVTEGDINFAAMKTWGEAAKQPKTWQKVAEMLNNGLMPPQDAEQPTKTEREQLQKGVAGVLAIEARAHADAPGRVVLRRLSNAEYTYTIRDLTGVASLDPAREFPADGAAGEGFTNTGSALVMSPVLVTKYLEAAKEVAGHAMLLPGGFRFSPHTTARDWTDDTLAKIRQFYSQFTDSGGSSTVNLQGIVLDTNGGGRLPVDKYLAATLIERDAVASGRKSIAAAAKEHQLNAKYLGLLWKALNDTKP